MADSLYSIYPPIFGNSLTIGNVSNVNVSQGVSAMIHTPGGALNPAQAALVYAEPAVDVTCHDLANVLTNCPLTAGLAISGQNAILQFQKRATGGFASGSNHTLVTSTAGYLYVDRIEASQDDEAGASASLKYIALSIDGETAPFSFNLAGALTGSPAINADYSLGPISFEGDFLDGVQRVSIMPGITCERKRGDGSLFATLAPVTRRRPKIEFDVLTNSPTSYIGAFNGTSQSLVAYLRKNINGGARYDNGDNEHLSFSASGSYSVQSLGVDREGMSMLRITLDVVGTIAVGIGVAIS